MTQEAVIRVRLDADEARQSLRDLGKEGEDAGKKSGSKLKERFKKGAKAVGLGAAFGAGYQATVGASSSGVGDIVGEAFGPLAAAVDQWVFGDLAPLARASRQAREETISAFSVLGKDAASDQSKAFYEQVTQLRLQTELGAREIRKSFSFGDEDVMEKLFTKFGELIGQGVEKLAELLLFGVTKGGR